MWPDRVSNPGPLTYESGDLPTALRGPGMEYSCSPVMSLMVHPVLSFSHEMIWMRSGT